MQGIISVPIILVILSILALLSVFFSLAETSFVALNKLRLRHLLAKGYKGAESAQRVFGKMDQLIILILVGNNFVNIAFSVVVTSVFVFIFGPKWGMIIATFCATTFILIFCEISPKIIAMRYSEKIALFLAPFIEPLIKVFHPFSEVFTYFSNLILRLFGGKLGKRLPLISEEELRLMIELGKEEGVVTDQEVKMLHKIFQFSDLKVEDIAVSKDKIIAVEKKDDPSEILRVLVEEGHSRIPVYEENIAKIIGIVYARDLLYLLLYKDLFILTDIIRPAFYVLGEVKISELLKEFQAKKIQIAVVVDKNKAAVGLVTLEDLLEEIVGEIDEQVLVPNS
jgi:CBS domain containing-hemolysin-like protein